MKKLVSILYSVLTLLLFISCQPTSEYPKKMIQAEQCMNTYPDSALTLLDSLQTIIFQEPEETQMYHRLLTIEARYKCYLPSTTDSIITIVTDYYQKPGYKDKLMKAYYLKGCIYDELQDMPQALKYYQQALQFSEGSKQYRTLALIYNQIGNVYLYQDMNKEAIPMFQNSYHYSKLTNSFTKQLYIIHNIARAYSELERKDSAIYYYKMAYQLAKKSGNKVAENTLLNELGGYYFNINEPELAISTLRSCNNEQTNTKPNYIGWGLLYQHINRPDSAKYFFLKSIETKGTIYATASAYLHLAKLEEAAGNHKEAFRLLRIHQQWQDSIKKITNTETAQRMHSMYNYQRTETENQKLKEENAQKRIKLHQFACLAIVLFIAGTGFTLYEKHKKRKLIEAEKKIGEMKEKLFEKSLKHITDNEIEINYLRIKLSQTEKEKQTLIEAQVKSLEAINNQIRSQQEERELKIKVLRQSDIYKRFHTESGEQNDLKNEEWLELQQAIDNTYDNFTGQLYTLYPKLSPIELRICCLIKIEIKVTTISLLIGRTKAAVSTARSKLYEKLQGKKGTPEMLDALLMEI